MIKKIVINKFRCFDYFEIDNLAPITIIGGRNNSGKSALLEAILVTITIKYPSVFWHLMGLRNISNVYSLPPQQIWNPLFYNMDDSSEFSIKIVQSNDTATFTASKIYDVIQSSNPKMNYYTPYSSLTNNALKETNINFSSLKVAIDTNKYKGDGQYHFQDNIPSHSNALVFQSSTISEKLPLPFGPVTFYRNLADDMSIPESVSKISLDKQKKELLVSVLKYWTINPHMFTSYLIQENICL